jgi:hypothetical protein
MRIKCNHRYTNPAPRLRHEYGGSGRTETKKKGVYFLSCPPPLVIPATTTRVHSLAPSPSASAELDLRGTALVSSPREEDGFLHRSARRGHAAPVQVQQRRPFPRRQVHPASILVQIRPHLPAMVPVSALLFVPFLLL